MVQVSIVLVNYNTKEMTAECIHSIQKHTLSVTYEIIVVDNDSIDGSQEFLRNVEGIKLICSENNLGFGRGNNLGVQEASGNLIFLLNTDTLIFEDSIGKMVKIFEEKESSLSLGSLGCYLLNANRELTESSFKFVSAKSVFKDFIEVLQRKSSLAPTLSTEVTDAKDSPVMKQVDYVSGAAMLVSKDIFDKIGGFDKDYFMYFEEADLQKRIQSLGLVSVLTDCTQIIHLEGGSTDGTSSKLTNRRRIMIQQGRNLFLKKNDKKNYIFYILFDLTYSFLRLFNTRYSFKENITFIYKNIKSY